MKRLIASLGVSASYFLSVSQVFAAPPEKIKLCPEGDNIFKNLCTLNFTGGLVGDLITFAFILAVIVALAFLIYGGIRWIAAGGDKTQIEGAREAITGAVIGLVIVFLAYFILNIILVFFTGHGLTDLKTPQLRGL